MVKYSDSIMKTILLITDNKEGHESVSNGVIANLETYKELQIVRLVVKLKFNLYKFLLKPFINNPKINKYLSLGLIKYFYHLSDDNIDFTQIDLIISTGGKTSFINVMVSKLYGVNNIFCSSLRGLSPDLFSYVISINSNDSFENILKFKLAPLKLNPDLDKVALFAKKVCIDPSRQKIWSLLIGGPTKEYQFTNQNLTYLVESLAQQAKASGVQLLLTTSRRTPKAVEDEIEKLSNKYANIAYCVLYNRNPEKIVANFLQLSHVVFTTEDSGSMITESIHSLKPTITIKPQSSNPHGIYQVFMENITQEMFVHSIHIEDIKNIELDNLEFMKYDNSHEEANFKKIVALL